MTMNLKEAITEPNVKIPNEWKCANPFIVKFTKKLKGYEILTNGFGFKIAQTVVHFFDRCPR